MISVNINQYWKDTLSDEFEKPYFAELVSFVKSAYTKGKVYPAGKDIFRALDLTPLPDVKVVIIGQDPYHGPGQANGLSFSVNDGVAIPPSLSNIFKEINRDLHLPSPTSGNLERWARQGVMLLNATLTVDAHQAGSHQNVGWEIFTDAVIKAIASEKSNVVYMLWGNYAQKKGQYIDASKNLVLKSPHPSPLSAHRGFIGNGHFSKANDYLNGLGIKAIDWR